MQYSVYGLPSISSGFQELIRRWWRTWASWALAGGENWSGSVHSTGAGIDNLAGMVEQSGQCGLWLSCYSVVAAHLLVGVATISRSDSECLHVATDYSNRINITAQHVLVCDSHVSVCYQLLLAPVSLHSGTPATQPSVIYWPLMTCTSGRLHDRQTDRQTDGRTDRQTDRQNDWYTPYKLSVCTLTPWCNSPWYGDECKSVPLYDGQDVLLLRVYSDIKTIIGKGTTEWMN